jgi:hypothetical protein
MRIAAIDRIDVSTTTQGIPVEFQQHPAKLKAVALVALSTAAVATMLAPPTLIAIDLTTNPQAMTALAERPLSTVLLAVGVLVCLALLYFPLRAGVSRLGTRSSVRLEHGMITVDEFGLTGHRQWSLPFNQFCGVSHHIRATLSGPRHEIILVHPDRARDVLLQLGNRAPEPGADHFAKLLGLPEVHAKELYGRRRIQSAEARGVDLQAAAA